jgi:hypothetical protein
MAAQSRLAMVSHHWQASAPRLQRGQMAGWLSSSRKGIRRYYSAGGVSSRMTVWVSVRTWTGFQLRAGTAT